jgi:hypothetical protein
VRFNKFEACSFMLQVVAVLASSAGLFADWIALPWRSTGGSCRWGNDLRLGEYPWKPYALAGDSFREDFFTGLARINANVEREAIVNISKWLSPRQHVIQPRLPSIPPVRIAASRVSMQIGNSCGLWRFILRAHPLFSFQSTTC